MRGRGRYKRDGSETEEGMVRDRWECEGRREGTREMGVRGRGRYKRDGSEREEGMVRER